MPAQERDAHLESLRAELRVLMADLNTRHHPVYPGDEEKIAALEAQVTEVKAAIAERRKQLA